MPLKHPPGEAQVDFGQAIVKMGGILRKIFFFVKATRASRPADPGQVWIRAVLQDSLRVTVRGCQSSL